MDQRAILRAMPSLVARMAHLRVHDRITLLCGLLAQEICTLPPGDRRMALEDVQDDLPQVLRATEDGMREALAQNTRGTP